MASNAIGMIETKGYVAALAAADAMVKAANVTITDRQQVGEGGPRGPRVRQQRRQRRVPARLHSKGPQIRTGQ